MADLLIHNAAIVIIQKLLQARANDSCYFVLGQIIVGQNLEEL